MLCVVNDLNMTCQCETRLKQVHSTFNELNNYLLQGKGGNKINKGVCWPVFHFRSDFFCNM